MALLLVLTLALGPGCRSLGQLGWDGYSWSNEAFAPNPVAEVPFFAGVVLGVIVGLPLCILSGPLAVFAYPREDGDEFFLSAALLPSLTLGTFFGTALATPFYPFGIPFLPEDPVVVDSKPR